MELFELYRACAPSARRRARALLHADEDALDVVHEVFAKLAALPPSQMPERPMAWVYRATTNACLNLLEARRRQRATLVAEPPPAPDAAGPVDARELLDKLWSELDELDRQIVVLHWLDELPQEEIAQLLGVWRRTVGRRLKRLKELAQVLAGERIAS